MIIKRKSGWICFIVGELKIGIEIFFSRVGPLAICVWHEYISILIQNIPLCVCLVVVFSRYKIITQNCIVDADLGVQGDGGSPVLGSFFGKYLDHAIGALC